MSVPVVLPDPVWPVGSKPPTRIYIGGQTYALTAPRIPLPPLAGAARVILNWLRSDRGTIAKNILYAFLPSGADPSVPANLLSIANGVEGAVRSSGMLQRINTSWQLQNVTAKDASGTSENFANSTHAADPGLDTGTVLPPQCSIAISWVITASYRGGKPRSYLPGISASAVNPPGTAAVDPTFAGLLEVEANSFLSACNGVTVGSGPMQLGTISFHSGHVVRPTPIFRAFVSARVHERLDSQRRRSGKESSFGVVP
jgi:hypothetical protein